VQLEIFPQFLHAAIFAAKLRKLPCDKNHVNMDVSLPGMLLLPQVQGLHDIVLTAGGTASNMQRFQT
jgi:hypothetical protein